MELLQTRGLKCPCCGEWIEIVIDCSAGGQEYIEDCQVCCRPMVIHVSIIDGLVAEIDSQCENP